MGSRISIHCVQATRLVVVIISFLLHRAVGAAIAKVSDTPKGTDTANSGYRG